MPIPSPADFRNRNKKHSEVREMMAQMAESAADKDKVDREIKKVVKGVAGKNLFNPADPDVTAGYTVSSTTGLLSSNTTFTASGFIPVEPSKNYSVSNKYQLAWYDSNKVYISGSPASDSSKTLMSPSNAAFVRAGFLTSQITTYQIEQSNAPTEYEPYTDVIKVPDSAIESVGGEKIIDASVSLSKVTFAKRSKNIFNKRAITPSCYVTPSTGVLVSSASFDTSDFIPVESDTQYFGKGSNVIRMTAFYDLSKTIVAGGINTDTDTFTTPSNAAYVRISIRKDDLDIFQLEKGSAQTSFAEYAYILEAPDGTPVVTNTSSNKSKWDGKTWATLGDSITANATWQGDVKSALGLVWSNFGIAGTRISGSAANAMWQDDRINAIPTTIDLITVMGGTNDWAQHTALGDENSTDTNTFNGALNVMAQKMYARWPLKRICFATTPYGELTSRGTPAINNIGLTTNDYAEAIRNFCKRSNLHCIDVALSAGYGTHNITEAMGGSTTDHLHMIKGSVASNGISTVYISGLKSIEPI